MRRRLLVATAAAGVLCATLSVIVAPQLTRRPNAAPVAYGATIKHDPPAFGLRKTPLVIAHRGASAYRAEHTLEAYRLAIAMGADYVEADLVMTHDGQLVARHENELSATTDVAHKKEFATRRTTKNVDGAPKTGWFTEDFTLAELKTLRAVPRGKKPAHGNADTVPSLQEIIDLVHTESAARGRPVGLYLELKSPAYFAALGLVPEPVLVSAVRHTDAPVIVESFDPNSLRTVHQLLPAVPLIQLMSGDDGGPSVTEVHTYANGVGVDRARIKKSANFVELAHREGLEVHVYTFRSEPLAEYRTFFKLGVDGVFTDNPDTAKAARDG